MSFTTVKAMLRTTGVALVAGIVLLALAVGCDSDFLTRTPPSSINPNNFYETEEDAVSAVNAVYASLQRLPLYGWQYHKVTTVPSDDSRIHNVPGQPFENHTFGASHPLLMDVFSELYEGVFRANLVIQQVPDIEMPQDKKTRILGEARFMRALYYWHLAANFGRVPLVEQAYPNNPEKAQKPKVDDVGVIWDFAISDLEEAVQALPASYGSANVGRATSGAARALLGKVHLYDENYQQAATALETVMNSNEYELMPSHREMFETDNNSEYIFEIQYQDTGGSVWGQVDAANTNEGSLRARVTMVEGGGGFGNFPPTQELVDEFESGDPRLDYAVWMDGDDYGEPGQFSEDGTYNPEWSPTGYSIQKGLTVDNAYDDAISTNWPLIRLADVMLMYAEAVNAKSSREPQEAIDAINQVRSRANMPTYPDPSLEYNIDASSSQQEIFEAIVHERRVELAFENHRYNDVRRWGMGEEELPGYQSPKHRYFPLPQLEVNTNQELEQHEVW